MRGFCLFKGERSRRKRRSKAPHQHVQAVTVRGQAVETGAMRGGAAWLQAAAAAQLQWQAPPAPQPQKALAVWFTYELSGAARGSERN